MASSSLDGWGTCLPITTVCIWLSFFMLCFLSPNLDDGFPKDLFNSCVAPRKSGAAIIADQPKLTLLMPSQTFLSWNWASSDGYPIRMVNTPNRTLTLVYGLCQAAIDSLVALEGKQNQNCSGIMSALVRSNVLDSVSKARLTKPHGLSSDSSNWCSYGSHSAWNWWIQLFFPATFTAK